MNEESTVERISGIGKQARFKIKEYKPPKEEGEIFPNMDEKGKIIGAVSRSEAHKGPEKKIHGGVRILVIDPQTKEIYLPKRSAEKDKDPNCLDYGAGEHSTVNRETGELETWTQTGERGLEEEIGLKPKDYRLTRIPGHILDETDPTQREWSTFYIAKVSKDQPLFPDKKEIDPSKGGWFKIADLLEIADGKPSKENPLVAHQIRPMLLNDLKINRIRKVLEEIISGKEVTA